MRINGLRCFVRGLGQEIHNQEQETQCSFSASQLATLCSDKSKINSNYFKRQIINSVPTSIKLSDVVTENPIIWCFPAAGLDVFYFYPQLLSFIIFIT